MPDSIRDGSGQGYQVKVNASNQLLTRATTVEQRLIATVAGDYYETFTGVINLTDANETPLIYIKNTDSTKRLVVDRILVDVWDSTGGADDGQLKYFKNPSYTGGSAITPECTNFVRTNVADGTFLKSPTTLTGTAWVVTPLIENEALVLEEGRFILYEGNSYAISVVPPTGNTDLDININIGIYYVDTALVV